jgi:hypothetical protein
VKKDEEKSDDEGDAKMLDTMVEVVASDDDDKKNLDVKGAHPKVPRQVKEPRKSVRLTSSPRLCFFLFFCLITFKEKRDHDLPVKKIKPMDDVKR